MTNSEAIVLLGSIQFDLTDGYYQREQYIEAVCVFDRLKEENDKLKAEIKQLKTEIEQLKKDNEDFLEDYNLLSKDFVMVCEENDKLKIKINKLKERYWNDKL